MTSCHVTVQRRRKPALFGVQKLGHGCRFKAGGSKDLFQIRAAGEILTSRWCRKRSGSRAPKGARDVTNLQEFSRSLPEMISKSRVFVIRLHPGEEGDVQQLLRLKIRSLRRAHAGPPRASKSGKRFHISSLVPNCCCR